MASPKSDQSTFGFLVSLAGLGVFGYSAYFMNYNGKKKTYLFSPYVNSILNYDNN